MKTVKPLFILACGLLVLLVSSPANAVTDWKYFSNLGYECVEYGDTSPEAYYGAGGAVYNYHSTADQVFVCPIPRVSINTGADQERLV